MIDPVAGWALSGENGRVRSSAGLAVSGQGADERIHLANNELIYIGAYRPYLA